MDDSGSPTQNTEGNDEYRPFEFGEASVSQAGVKQPKRHFNPFILAVVIVSALALDFLFIFSNNTNGYLDGLFANRKTTINRNNKKINLPADVETVNPQTESDDDLAVVDTQPTSYGRVTVGGSFACALSADNQAYCWGYNYWGQLGNGSNYTGEVATKIDTSGVLKGKTIKSISAGLGHTCVIASDDQVYCWGDNDNGQLGDGSYIPKNSPVAVSTSGVLSGKTIIYLAVGWAHTCALASDYKVYCWGYNVDGRLGNNSETKSNLPVAVDSSGVMKDKKIVSISDVCAIDSAGKAYCWGGNWSGQLGNGLREDSMVPVTVDMTGQLNGKTFTSLDAGSGVNCAVASDKKAYCWGSGNSTPSAIENSGVLNGLDILSVAAGVSAKCVIASDDQVYCWGSNIRGGLGNDSKIDSSSPVAVDTRGVMKDKKIVSIASGGYTCALSDENEVFCWGDDNHLGQLGNLVATDGFVPVVVQGMGE